MKTKKTPLEKTKKKNDIGECTPSTQWTIRGISIEARNAAQMAAQKNNEFIGSWISRKILQAAHDDLKGSKEVAKSEEGLDFLNPVQASIIEQLTNLNNKFDQFSNKKSFIKKLFNK